VSRRRIPKSNERSERGKAITPCAAADLYMTAGDPRAPAESRRNPPPEATNPTERRKRSVRRYRLKDTKHKVQLPPPAAIFRLITQWTTRYRPMSANAGTHRSNSATLKSANRGKHERRIRNEPHQDISESAGCRWNRSAH